VARKSPKKKLGLPAQPRPKPPPPVRSTAAGPAERRTMLLWGGVAAAVVIAVVLAFVLTRGGSSGKTPPAVVWSQLGPLQTGPPPWNNGVGQLTDRLAPLGLSQLGSEGTALHIHQHLDVWVNGKKVTVPAGIGIYDDSYLTELHVHDTSGVIHVESPHVSTFTLGQLFGEWGVKLTSTCIGRYCGNLQWWVNGEKMTGDPAALELESHQEIAIVFGKPPLVVPKSYKFAAGE
jgi:hypothetical protein